MLFKPDLFATLRVSTNSGPYWSGWITINCRVNLLDDMDGGKEALERFAREAVALYGPDATKLLLHRAEIAVEYGDKVSAKEWREVAAIAERITRSG